MATAYLIELPGVSQEQGLAILSELGLSNTLPSGQILHIEGPMEGGLRVVDVWESQEIFDRFIRERLLPAVQRAGATFPADLQPSATWPVSRVLK